MATVRNLSEEQIEYITEWFRTWECPEEEDLLETLNRMLDQEFMQKRSDIQNWVAYEVANDGGYYRRDLSAIHEVMQNSEDNDIEDTIRNGYMFEQCMVALGFGCEDEDLKECLYEILLELFVEALEE